MGHEESLMSLALLCLEEKDEKNGFLYMKEAAEAGIPRAQYAAGMMYLEGHGTEENRDEAFRWIEAAAENGVDEAEAVLEHNGYMILEIQRKSIENSKRAFNAFFDAEMEENRRSSLRERGAFPSSEARFKGVNLVPKEKVPAKPGNEM